MKVDTKVHAQRAQELRSKAQEAKDAAGGEQIAAKKAKADAARFKDEYTTTKAAGEQLLNEAAKLRAEAAEQTQKALGGRGLHAMANVVRGFGALMSKLSGHRLETTVTLRNDPEAKATTERMLKLAAEKEAAGKEKLSLAEQSWVKATEALTKMEGHERTAAAHMEAAGRFIKEARSEDRAARLGEMAEHVGAAVKDTLDPLIAQAKAEGQRLKEEVKGDLRELGSQLLNSAREALKGLLAVGVRLLTDAAKQLLGPAPEPAMAVGGREPSFAEQTQTFKQAVREAGTALSADAKTRLSAFIEKQGERVGAAAPEKKQAPAAKPEQKAAPQPKPFEPGRVDFGGGGPRAEVKLPKGAPIDSPLPGEKKISESLLAARWAAEAVGIDWTKFTSTGELKKALEGAHNTLKIKHSSSPFEVKSRIAERLGLKDPKNLDVDVVRELYAKREAFGMPRLAPRAEFESALKKLGMSPDAAIDEIAMVGTARSTQGTAEAAKALKAKPDDAAAKAAFASAAGSLDKAKRVLVDVIRATPADDRRVLALDACDAVEVAHGKPAATTKLIHAAETLTQSPLFGGAMKKALNLDDKGLTKALEPVMRAVEWVSLGELVTPSSVLAYPGSLTAAQKKEHIFPLALRGVDLAKELALLDDAGLETLKNHMSGKGSASAQILGVIRQVAALSERRDFRTKEQLSADEIREELKKNAARGQLAQGTLDALSPILDDVIRALRQ